MSRPSLGCSTRRHRTVLSTRLHIRPLTTLREKPVKIGANAIRLPQNQVLQESIAHLLTRPVGRPPNHVQRYERGSIMVTSNLPFDEWTEVFGSASPARCSTGSRTTSTSSK